MFGRTTTGTHIRLTRFDHELGTYEPLEIGIGY